MDLSHRGYAKSLVHARVTMIIQAIKQAERALNSLSDSLDMKDIRQSDFAHDADLSEHLLILREMKESLMASTVSGGILDEHFDREPA